MTRTNPKLKQRQNRELTDYQHVRQKTEMYLGSRDITTETFVNFDGNTLQLEEVEYVPSLLTAFRELLDNAMDELISNKSGDIVKVEFDPKTLTMSVRDNGAGIPLDQIEMVFTKLRAGSNFGERETVVGTNGIGASAVNFVSSHFKVDVWGNGIHYVQEYEEDNFNGEEIIIKNPRQSPITRGSGTKVQFTPSSTVFKNMVLPESLVKARIYELAFIYPKIKFYFNGSRINRPDLFKGHNVIEVDVNAPEHKFSNTFYIVPNFHTGNEEHMHAVVNGICAYTGGEHVKAFRSKFFSGLNAAMAKEAKQKKVTLNRSDVAAGLLVFGVTQMQAPNFNSQSKHFLVNADAAKWINSGLDEKVFNKIKRQNPEWIDSILERAVNRNAIKDDNDAKKISKKAVKTNVAKLKDANGRDRSKCILIIGEGDSAVNLITNSRDPDIHGILPLRGKIMNVHEETPAKALKSAALADIVSALGLVYGQPAMRHQLRYGKIYIATDEDVDGYHILCLLINFLYSYWPELFKDKNKPFAFKVMTPFVILKKGKSRKYIYQPDYHKFNASNYKGWEIIRAKGLGTLEDEEWVDILGDPNLIPFYDDGELKSSLDLMFNDKRADDRKSWFEASGNN